MNKWLLFVGLIALIILVLAVFAVTQAKKQKEIRKKHAGFPKGYWMNKGIGIGMAIGVAMGVALGNVGLGIGVGVAIGVAIGSGLEKKHKDEMRPLTEEEKKLKKQALLFTISTLIIGIIVFVITYFILK